MPLIRDHLVVTEQNVGFGNKNQSKEVDSLFHHESCYGR